MSPSWAWLPVLALLSSARAAADVPDVALEGPAGCPDGAAATERLRAVLGEEADAELPAIAASVRVRGEDGGFVAEIVLREGEHESRRELADASCALVVEAAVLVIAIALVPELVPAPEADPVAPSEPPAVESPPGDRTTAFLRLAAHGSIGVLPGVVLGGELGGGVRHGALRLELAVRGLPLVGARFGVAPSLGADLALAAGLLRAMGVITLDPAVELHLGGGIDAGAGLGRGVGLSVPRDAAAPWVAIEAAAGLAWVPIAELALVLEVELVVPVVRPVFVAGGLGTLYRPEPVGGSLRLSVEARVP